MKDTSCVGVGKQKQETVLFKNKLYNMTINTFKYILSSIFYMLKNIKMTPKANKHIGNINVPWIREEQLNSQATVKDFERLSDPDQMFSYFTSAVAGLFDTTHLCTACEAFTKTTHVSSL